MMTRAALATAILVGAAAIPRAELTPQTRPAGGTQSFASGATAILVDVVVRDREGRPVTDLAAADFEVAEDGVRQRIDTFSRVSRGGGIGVGVTWKSLSPTTAILTPAEDPPAADVSEPPAEAATVAIVFDHLSSESLRLAQKATLEYVPLTGESQSKVGVFATDPGIRVLQGYTTDPVKVRQAVARISPSGTAAEEQNTDRTQALLSQRRTLEEQTQSIAGTAAGLSGAALVQNASEMGRRQTELRLVQTELNMIRAFDSIDRDHRGYDVARTLLTVVGSLAEMPGRKTIVYFSEGLPASPALAARLDVVIDAANRAHVTTYAIDANGLRTNSASANVLKEMQAFVDERSSQLASGTDRTHQPLTMGFERVEDTLNLDSRTGLARLAGETGGLLFEGSNDLSAAFRRIDEDNRFHYLLTYSPRNVAFDGKFRTIAVKVRRPGVQVFARKGYRAVRTASFAAGDAVNNEASALALVHRRPLPNAFPIHAAGFSFPDPQRPGLIALLVQARTGALTFDVDPKLSTYSGRAAIVVRIRDAQGQDAQRVSQQYILAGDAKDVDAARNGEILFYREVDLAPGVYSMDAVVYDASSRRGSARIATLTVPAAEPAAFGMSSLLLVNRIEEIKEEIKDVRDAGHQPGPLFVNGGLIYPNLGEPVRRTGAGELPFYFTLYGNMQDVSASAQVLRNGRLLVEAPVELPAPTGSRIQYVGRLPIASLMPGTYELRVHVTNGGRQLSRTAFITLQ
jgi:VWFA-related protein